MSSSHLFHVITARDSWKTNFYFKKEGLSILFYFFQNLLSSCFCEPLNTTGFSICWCQSQKMERIARTQPSKRENWSFQALKNRNIFFFLKCGTATHSKSKPDTASLFCSCQKCWITPSPALKPGCHLQKDCTPWTQIPSLFHGATSLAAGMPWSGGSYTQGWFGPWLAQDLGMKRAPEHKLEVVGNFPRHFFGGVSQNGNLLKLKPFTREGLSEQSSQLKGGKQKQESE